MKTINPEYVEAVKKGVNGSPYFSLLCMKILDFGAGKSHLEIETAHDKHLQPFGAVHGGVFASIIDAAAFWSVYPEADEDVGMTTVDLKVNYLAPSFGSKLVARGRCIKLGKTWGSPKRKSPTGMARCWHTGHPRSSCCPALPWSTTTSFHRNSSRFHRASEQECRPIVLHACWPKDHEPVRCFSDQQTSARIVQICRLLSLRPSRWSVRRERQYLPSSRPVASIRCSEK